VIEGRYTSLSRVEIESRGAAVYELLKECTLCPRRCRIDRNIGQVGKCSVGCEAMVASYGPHFGEERPLVGINGSGTIFFGGCNLSCIFCQNYDISRLNFGDVIPTHRLARMMINLQDSGCHNINLVTPTHQIPQILDALGKALELGLRLPIVYNCGGYESVEVLRLLDGIVDIYMPDMKYGNNRVGMELSGVPDYWDRNREAVLEMHRQVGDLKIVSIDEGTISYELAINGLLVRHLVLPKNIADIEEIVKFLANSVSRDTYINIMGQYRPAYQANGHAILGRAVTSEEHQEAVRIAKEAGLWRFA